MTTNHVEGAGHEWTWQWFGLVERHQPLSDSKLRPAGLRTCACGAFERVEPNWGKTPVQEADEVEREAKDEAKRAKMREYNRRKKAEGSTA